MDTAADCAKVVPLNYKGRLSYWYVGPNQASPQIDRDMDTAFWAAFAKTYPNITVDKQNLDYNEMLDKTPHGGAGQCGADGGEDFPSCGGSEFAAKGQLALLKPEDVGYATADFWPGAMKSVTWAGKTYGIPTNNETMALIWNAGLFHDAGLDPETPPATWDELVVFSKQIKDDGQKRLWHGGAGERGEYAVPLHAAALGLWRRRAG